MTGEKNKILLFILDKTYCKMRNRRITGLYVHRRISGSGFSRLGHFASLIPTAPSPTFGRAALLRKPLYARPNVAYSRNVMRHLDGKICMKIHTKSILRTNLSKNLLNKF